jgi:hypothetical protein
MELIIVKLLYQSISRVLVTNKNVLKAIFIKECVTSLKNPQRLLAVGGVFGPLLEQVILGGKRRWMRGMRGAFGISRGRMRRVGVVVFRCRGFGIQGVIATKLTGLPIFKEKIISAKYFIVVPNCIGMMWVSTWVHTH